MTNQENAIRRALRQQLMGDRLMGVTYVPVPKVLDERTLRGGAKVRRLDAETLAQKEQSLRVLDESAVRNCTKCELSATRTQTVFGQGSAAARLVFVGEAPGYEEDRQGLAFVGPAGQLLSKMIVAMGLSREDVFICNVLKCRPPNNRDPSADEILACRGHLAEQLRLIEPEVVVALGAPASKTLLNTAVSIGKLRGRFHDYYPSGVHGEGPSIPLMPTYHPAYLLRSPSEKGKTWDDLQLVMQLLGLALPEL